MEISMKMGTMDLSVLFKDPMEVDWSSIADTFSKRCEQEFEKIAKIRKDLFRMEPFLQIIRDMMEIGILPASVAMPAKYMDFKFIYDRLSSAECRLMQVRKYLEESKNVSNKPYMYGNAKTILIHPPKKWEI